MWISSILLLSWNELIRAICWTFVHSLWQGLVVAILAGGTIMFSKRMKSSQRYNLLVALFSIFLLSTLFTLGWQLYGFNQGQINSSPSHNSYSQIVEIKQELFNSTQSQTTHDQFIFSSFIKFLNKNAMLLVALWFILFTVKFVRLIANLANIQRIKNYDVTEAGPFWRDKLKELAGLLRISKTVKLLESGIVKVPMVLGTLKPVVLVPIGLLTNLPGDEVEAILLHELAHIRRSDYLINLFQSFAETIFFFNPALLWISSLIREERENCCDDIAVMRSGNKITYVKALVSFEEFHYSPISYAPAISGSGNFLLKRAKRILQNEHKKLNTMEKGIFAACIITIGCFSFMSTNANKTPLPQKIESNAVARNASASKESVKYNILKQKDSTPPKQEFPSISTNTQSNNGTLKSTIEATDSKGTKYKLVKVNGAIKELYVNGKKIPESQYDSYGTAIERIQESSNNKVRLDYLANNDQEKLAYKKLMEAQLENANSKLVQEKLGLLAENQNELYKKIIGEQVQNEMALKMQLEGLQSPLIKLNYINSEADLAKLLAESSRVQERIKEIEEQRSQKIEPKDDAVLKTEQEKLAANLAAIEEQIEQTRKIMNLQGELGNRDTLIMQKKMAEQNQTLLLLKMQSLENSNDKLAFEKALKARMGPSMEDQKKMLHGLIEDLVNTKAVRDQKSIDWFALTDDELIVNGKKQSARLHEKLKMKYEIGPGFGFYYGNVPVSGTGVFFPKEK